jgi:acetoin utilization deacetylase AcuC-like enzyme
VTKTSVIFSPNYYRHTPGRDHPESAKRLKAIITELERTSFLETNTVKLVNPAKALIEQVETVHDRKYVRYVKAFCKSGGGFLDAGDTKVSVQSFDVALDAAGGALTAVDQVMKRRSENAFALVRPPGHHATRFYGLGFCIFNNIAIAAEHLLREFKLERVLILDVDSHHGNGTQSIFYETDKVLYTSLHEDPRDFPGTGFSGEVGDREGTGFTVNIPLPLKTGDQIYLKGLREIVTPIAREYKPQFILVSAGFDSHYADPVGRLRLSARCYEEIFGMVANLASELCDRKLVLVLEGGYNLKFVGKLAIQALAKISGNQYRLDDEVPRDTLKKKENGEKALREVREVQREFWHVD